MFDYSNLYITLHAETCIAPFIIVHNDGFLLGSGQYELKVSNLIYCWNAINMISLNVIVIKHISLVTGMKCTYNYFFCKYIQRIVW